MLTQIGIFVNNDHSIQLSLDINLTLLNFVRIPGKNCFSEFQPLGNYQGLVVKPRVWFADFAMSGL